MSCEQDRAGWPAFLFAGGALVFLSAAGATGCTYDFDAPFAGGVADTDAGSGGSGGSGGSAAGQGDASTDQSAGSGGAQDGAAGAPAEASLTDHADDPPVEASDAPVEDVAGQDVVGDTGGCPTNHVCVPVAPSAWSGPYALHETTGSSPGCTGAYDDEIFRVYDGLQAPAPSCSPCSCGAVTGMSCRMDLDLFQSNDCSGLPCKSIDTTATVCTSFSCTGSPDLGSIRFASYVAGSGSCPPSAQSPTVNPAYWDVQAVLCEAPAGTGCESGAVCLPEPVAPLQSSLCVVRAGTHPCEGPFTVRKDYFEDFDDDRDCTACTCSAPQGGSCGGSIVLSLPGPSCGGAGVIYPEGYCMNLDPQVTNGAIIGPLNLTGASCQASGGAPTGTASPHSRVTVCCLP